MFAFRLAATLGMTVRELLERIDSRELAEWRAFDELSPLDYARRAELASAKSTALIFNANRDPDRSEPAVLDDFLPQWGESLRAAATLEIVDPAAAVARMRETMASMRG